MTIKQDGVLYVAFGVAYLAMTLVSARSLRETNPDVPIHIVTNIDFDFSLIDFWDNNKDSSTFMHLPSDQNREIKCALDKYSPFTKTLFLDCDTVILDDIALGWELLNNFDICIKQNSRPQRDPRKGNPAIYFGYQSGELPHWNSGVILFRKNEQTREFFERWCESFKKGNLPFDQVALAEVILSSGNWRFLSLDDRWNSSGPTIGRIAWRKTAKIFHYTTIMVPSVVNQLRNVKEIIARQGLPTNDIETVIARRKASRRKSLGYGRYLIGEAIFRFVSE